MYGAFGGPRVTSGRSCGEVQRPTGSDGSGVWTKRVQLRRNCGSEMAFADTEQRAGPERLVDRDPGVAWYDI